MVHIPKISNILHFLLATPFLQILVNSLDITDRWLTNEKNIEIQRLLISMVRYLFFNVITSKLLFHDLYVT